MAKRITIRILICDPRPYGLGYCCPYAFFKLHKRTGAIAARLGVTERAIRYWKMAFKDGHMKCQNAGKCLKGRLF
jgi:hypothetical protein